MKDFEKYLFDLLWNSGEDCCSKCVHNRCDIVNNREIERLKREAINEHKL